MNTVAHGDLVLLLALPSVTLKDLIPDAVSVMMVAHGEVVLVLLMAKVMITHRLHFGA